MQESLPCPECKVELALPTSAADQAVQCPRCGHFIEARERSSAAVTTAPPLPIGRGIVTEDHELFEEPRRLIPREPLWGSWFAILTMSAITASVVAFLTNAFASYEFAELHALEAEMRAMEQGLGPQHPGVMALKAALSVQTRRWGRAHRLAWDLIEYTTWPTLFALVVWMHLASSNLSVLQARNVLYSPPLLLFIFCVPLLNAIVAYLVLQELWRTSDPFATDDLDDWRKTRPSWVLRIAGLNCLCAPILIFIVFRLDRNFGAPGVAVAMDSIACVANLNLVIAGVLLIYAIRKITKRQRQRYIRLYEDPA